MSTISKPVFTSGSPFLIAHGGCPFVHRVALACSHKKWPVQRIDIDLKSKPNWFLELYPAGSVPVFVIKEHEHEDKPTVLYESLVLIDFVEDFWGERGPSLLPRSASERAAARIVISRFDSKLVPLYYGLLRSPDKAAAKTAAADLRKELAWLQDRMKGDGPFFLGQEFTSVDAAILPWLLRDFVIQHYRGYDLFSGLDRLRTYVDGVRKESVVMDTMVDVEGKSWNEYMLDLYQPYGREVANYFEDEN